MSLLITVIACIGLSISPAQAQRIYLDAVLEPASKSKAAYFLEPGGTDGAGGFLAQIFSLDGSLKAKGRYADAQYRIPDGRFVFYFPNGKVESEGNYQKGRKNGVWARNDKWGRELAEKVYDAAPLKNLVYTLAQTMPQFPGGEKAMVRYVREKVGKTSGEVLASFKGINGAPAFSPAGTRLALLPLPGFCDFCSSDEQAVEAVSNKSTDSAAQEVVEPAVR